MIGTELADFARNLAIGQPQLLIEQWAVSSDNPDAPLSLAFPDRSFDLVIALDVVAALPPGHRTGFVRELVRVAEREAVCAAPLGTGPHLLIDRSLINLYRERFRSVHSELARQVDYGLPTPSEFLLWIRPGEDADVFYAGDVSAYQHRAETILYRASRKGLRSFLLRPTHTHTSPVASAADEPDTVPTRRHRRFFLHIRRI